MTFAEAEEYLSSLISYEKYGRAKYGQQTFSLTVFRHILERLGNPERQLRAIHVAGTDGKGSVCQYLTCILQQAGFSVGTYTSPHLQTVRERIQINRVPIDELDFANQVERVRPILDSLPDALPAETPEGERNPPSFFEALTAMAFLHFADKQVDYAVIEVGLGGRLDATNVILPIACVLTALDLEHTDLLGPDLESIAREKTGIAKPGTPFFISRQAPGLESYIESLCVEKRAIPCLAGAAADVNILERSADGYVFENNLTWTATEKGSWNLIPEAGTDKPMVYRTPLLGNHQVRNAALAVNVLLWLREREVILQLTSEILQQGLDKADWPARIEVFKKGEIASPVVILDCAHTVQAAKTLRETLDELFPTQERVFVVGFLKGKSIEKCLSQLIRKNDVLFCTCSHSARSLSSDEVFHLAVAAQSMGEIPVETVIENIGSAESLKDILLRVQQEKTVTIAGSVYLAAELRRVLFSLGYRPLRRCQDSTDRR